MTQFTKMQAQVEELRKTLADVSENGSLDIATRKAKAGAVVADLTKLADAVEKQKKKAQETDPDKILYNPAMCEKILAFVKEFEQLVAAAREVAARVQSDFDVADRKRKEQQAALEAEEAARTSAQKKAKEDEEFAASQRRAAEEEARRAAEEEERRRAAEEEGRRRAEEEEARRKREAEEARRRAEEEEARRKREAEEAKYTVSVLLVGGKSKYTLDLPKGGKTTIQEIKEMIEAQDAQYPASRQFLIALGKKLDDTKTIDEYGFSKGVTFHLGMSHAKPAAAAAPAAAAPSAPAPAASPSAAATAAAAPKPATPVASGAAGGEVLSKDAIIKGVLDALGKVKANTSKESFVGAMKTLATLLNNVVDHPDDSKYRRVRLENASLRTKLFGLEGGIDAALALGFQHSVEEPGTLFMRSVNPHLLAVRQLLVDALKAHGVALDPPAAAAAAAATGAGASAPPNPWAALGGMGGMGGMGAMMNNPMMRELMSNPGMMQMAMEQTREMMRNPEMMRSMMATMGMDPSMADMLSNPQFADMLGQAQSNPQLLQQMMSGLGNAYGAFNSPTMPQMPTTMPQMPTTMPQMPTTTSSTSSTTPQQAGARAPAAEDDEDAMLQEALRLSMEEHDKKKKDNNGGQPPLD